MKKGHNPAFLKKMEGLLLEEKARLERELAKFTHRNPKAKEEDFDADFPNLGDKMDENAAEVAQFSDNLSLENELERALRDVISALGAIKKGKYGTCKYCGQNIDERRLEARPMSSSCIKCKKTLTQEV
jgi:DnaK suppressor protein